MIRSQVISFFSPKERNYAVHRLNDSGQEKKKRKKERKFIGATSIGECGYKD